MKNTLNVAEKKYNEQSTAAASSEWALGINDIYCHARNKKC